MKAKITKVGYMVDGEPKGFEFDCMNGAIGFEILTYDGSILYGGYTVEELVNIIEKESR